ncbi:hypothetical protein Y1Q_0011157 [Alligator mississippiensis]|uniref:GB1/RHD3-type G domain-containing protein n=1 Tax=Alligator mississippiensis TaxID=8496 RepID=A0A151MRN1_ALLMI|nr:hypothetical protein Y1Q_0011157 [Alligator mississippiensis]
MASETSMPAPICLIENDPTDGLLVNQEALAQLQAGSQPVVVVAISGLYRIGKSCLMNRLAGRRTGFSTTQSHTKGIWMWCLPHPRRPDHMLVLLDTEGLGDVAKGNTKNDSWILRCLCCSPAPWCTTACARPTSVPWTSRSILGPGAG